MTWWLLAGTVIGVVLGAILVLRKFAGIGRQR